MDGLKDIRMTKIIILFVFTFSISIGQERYSRTKFGEGWNTYKGCVTVREHVLIENSKEMVVMDSKSCNIEKGRWYSIWENRYFDDPKNVDIDHTVPLKWAFTHGADKWTPKQRNDYANNYTDNLHLVPMSVYSNRSKGAKGPDKWMPAESRCLYVVTFMAIVRKYNLQFTEAEFTKVNEIQKKECFN